MMREIRLLEATMPRFSSFIFIFGAPYSRNPSSRALTTSSEIGSRGLPASGCASIQQHVAPGTPGILHCADAG